MAYFKRGTLLAATGQSLSSWLHHSSDRIPQSVTYDCSRGLWTSGYHPIGHCGLTVKYQTDTQTGVCVVALLVLVSFSSNVCQFECLSVRMSVNSNVCQLEHLTIDALVRACTFHHLYSSRLMLVTTSDLIARPKCYSLIERYSYLLI